MLRYCVGSCPYSQEFQDCKQAPRCLGRSGLEAMTFALPSCSSALLPYALFCQLLAGA